MLMLWCAVFRVYLLVFGRNNDARFSAVRRVGGKTKRGLGGLGLLGWLRWRGAVRGAGVLRLVSVSGVA